MWMNALFLFLSPSSTFSPRFRSLLFVVIVFSLFLSSSLNSITAAPSLCLMRIEQRIALSCTVAFVVFTFLFPAAILALVINGGIERSWRWGRSQYSPPSARITLSWLLLWLKTGSLHSISSRLINTRKNMSSSYPSNLNCHNS